MGFNETEPLQQNLASGFCIATALAIPELCVRRLGDHQNDENLGIDRTSCLDDHVPFLTTADSAIKLHPNATKPAPGWKGLEYKAAFPSVRPPGANFYPPDMDKTEFELWKNSLTEGERQEANGFFSVIKRHSEKSLDATGNSDSNHALAPSHDLYYVPYSQEYSSYLTEASELLCKASELTSSPSLKRLLQTKATAFLSNDYYDSDIAWMELLA
ncbi:hypothetical protein Cgig2_031332 [Carnegiea gigantea]|uniref:Uncharacterized protein n=1 Tax=Carnegiea gigantea TaxID=171969 RepID=A0A9Q1GM14_9CARY|nr:hypothetical protein Cgig2_031332 [Carnegiea gigantea]